MADVKISQLPAATTPLVGTEEVPLVQSGVTKRVSVVSLFPSAGVTTDLLVLVRNSTGSPLTKGTVVYINGATGQTPTVAKALASSDATSAQTLGMVRDTIANNSTGYVVATGLITDIDTSAYTDGAQLYLSGVTAGAVTSTKPYAPIHLVYVGVVEHAHPTQGKIFVKVQNGYELDELHNVSAQTPSNGQTLVYNSTSQLWESAQLGLTNGVTGTLPVGNGGTGLTSPGTNGNVLTSNGTAWVSSAPASGVSLSADNTWTGTQTFAGTSAKFGAALTNAAETATVSATAATGTINYDITTQSVLYYTSNASANWTVNFRASSGTSLNTALATGQSVTVAFLVTQGATAYYNSSVQVDGTTSGVTTRWIGGAPTTGNASGIDSYRYVIIKTASATFTVLASVNQFKA